MEFQLSHRCNEQMYLEDPKVERGTTWCLLRVSEFPAFTETLPNGQCQLEFCTPVRHNIYKVIELLKLLCML